MVEDAQTKPLTQEERTVYNDRINAAMKEAGYDYSYNPSNNEAIWRPRTLEEARVLHKAIVLAGGFDTNPHFKEWEIWAAVCKKENGWWPVK